MANGILLDTSVLRVFSSAKRLDLLARWYPLIITSAILYEHAKAPADAVQHLSTSMKAGDVVLEPTSLVRQAQALSEANPLLSVTDAEAILFAQDKGYAILVADREFRNECARRKIPTSGVASILQALRRAGQLSATQLKAVAKKMEVDGYYEFSQDERAGLGL